MIENGTLTFEEMFKTIFTLLLTGQGIGQAAQFSGDVGDASIAAVRIYKILDEPYQIKNTNQPEDISCWTGKITFKDVSFHYPTRPNAKIFTNLNLTIYPGENVAFVG